MMIRLRPVFFSVLVIINFGCAGDDAFKKLKSSVFFLECNCPASHRMHGEKAHGRNDGTRFENIN